MAASSDLQEQFRVIQEQQKMRFKERTTRNQERELESEARCIPNNTHHQNDLELKTVTQLKQVPKGPEPKLAAPSSNDGDVQYLQTQIERLQLENSQLNSRVKQTEVRLVQLNHQREEERRAMGGTSGTVTQRIVELSKKNRELNAELASERNKVRELQTKVKQLQKQISEKEPDSSSSHGHTQSKGEETEGSLQLMVDQLKEQLQASNQKRTEYRNECQMLKQELKLAQKVLSKEVGEGISVATLLKSGSGWRGRSQQIIALQNKIGELQKRLEESGKSTKTFSASSSRLNADRRQATVLKKIEDSKKKSLEVTQSELAALQSEHSKLQQQCSALKSRNKILTAELKSIRSQTSGKLESPSLSQPRPPSTESKQELERVMVLEQRNQRLQTQLAKCVSELQTLKASQSNEHSRTRSPTVTRQPKSAPLPPIATPPHSRSCTRSVPRKMAATEQPHHKAEEDTLAQVSHIEKERLLDLTISLQQRLDLTNDKLVTTETELLNFKQRPSVSKDKTPSAVRKLEEELSLTRNENEVLKETLEATRQEKLADIKALNNLMRETKCTFVDSVRQLCVKN